jgi:hypothetical protein
VRRPFWFVPVAVLAAVSACDGGSEAPSRSSAGPPPPTAVVCGDAPGFRETAAAYRRASGESTSDQERLVLGNRAGFHASLAIIADLRCSVQSVQADDPLRMALEAARQAESERGFYASAFHWAEANFLASQVIALLIREMPLAASG